MSSELFKQLPQSRSCHVTRTLNGPPLLLPARAPIRAGEFNIWEKEHVRRQCPLITGHLESTALTNNLP
jgi:hypothetical protein